MHTVREEVHRDPSGKPPRLGAESYEVTVRRLVPPVPLPSRAAPIYFQKPPPTSSSSSWRRRPRRPCSSMSGQRGCTHKWGLSRKSLGAHVLQELVSAP